MPAGRTDSTNFTVYLSRTKEVHLLAQLTTALMLQSVTDAMETTTSTMHRAGLGPQGLTELDARASAGSGREETGKPAAVQVGRRRLCPRPFRSPSGPHD